MADAGLPRHVDTLDSSSKSLHVASDVAFTGEVVGRDIVLGQLEHRVVAHTRPIDLGDCPCDGGERQSIRAEMPPELSAADEVGLRSEPNVWTCPIFADCLHCFDPVSVGAEVVDHLHSVVRLRLPHAFSVADVGGAAVEFDRMLAGASLLPAFESGRGSPGTRGSAPLEIGRVDARPDAVAVCSNLRLVEKAHSEEPRQQVIGRIDERPPCVGLLRCGETLRRRRRLGFAVIELALASADSAEEAVNGNLSVVRLHPFGLCITESLESAGVTVERRECVLDLCHPELEVGELAGEVVCAPVVEARELRGE